MIAQSTHAQAPRNGAPRTERRSALDYCMDVRLPGSIVETKTLRRKERAMGDDSWLPTTGRPFPLWSTESGIAGARREDHPKDLGARPWVDAAAMRPA